MKFGSFSLNTKVKVTTNRKNRKNQIGTVLKVSGNGWHEVKFSDNSVIKFRTSELKHEITVSQLVQQVKTLTIKKEVTNSNKKKVLSDLFKFIKTGNLNKVKSLFNEYKLDVNHEINKYNLSFNDNIYNVDQKNEWISMLNIASFYGKLNIVKFLLEKGAINRKTIDCGTVYAILGGQLDVVKYFIEKENVDINCKKQSNGYTNLMLASSSGHVDIIVYLLSKGADIKKINNDNDNAISVAKSKTIKDFLINSLPKNYIVKLTDGQKTENKIRKSGLNGDTCFICLEEYKKGDEIVLLHGPNVPKNHQHHMHASHIKDLAKDVCPICDKNIHTISTKFGKCMYFQRYKIK